MRKLTQKIRWIFHIKKERGLKVQDTPFDFVRTRKYILRELASSKEASTIIGVYSKSFGDGMFLMVVEDIAPSGRETIITFHPFDMSGKTLKNTRVALDEIEMVFPFNKVKKPGLTGYPASKHGL